MSVRINTNIEALNAQRNLSNTSLQFAKSVEKLSSGLRINRAADDAAGEEDAGQVGRVIGEAETGAAVAGIADLLQRAGRLGVLRSRESGKRRQPLNRRG